MFGSSVVVPKVPIVIHRVGDPMQKGHREDISSIYSGRDGGLFGVQDFHPSSSFLEMRQRTDLSQKHRNLVRAGVTDHLWLTRDEEKQIRTAGISKKKISSLVDGFFAGVVST